MGNCVPINLKHDTLFLNIKFHLQYPVENNVLAHSHLIQPVQLIHVRLWRPQPTFNSSCQYEKNLHLRKKFWLKKSLEAEESQNFISRTKTDSVNGANTDQSKSAPKLQGMCSTRVLPVQTITVPEALIMAWNFLSAADLCTMARMLAVWLRNRTDKSRYLHLGIIKMHTPLSLSHDVSHLAKITSIQIHIHSGRGTSAYMDR